MLTQELGLPFEPKDSAALAWAWRKHAAVWDHIPEAMDDAFKHFASGADRSDPRKFYRAWYEWVRHQANEILLEQSTPPDVPESFWEEVQDELDDSESEALSETS